VPELVSLCQLWPEHRVNWGRAGYVDTLLSRTILFHAKDTPGKLRHSRYNRLMRDTNLKRGTDNNRRKVHHKGMVIAFGKASTKKVEYEGDEGVLFRVIDESETPDCFSDH